MDDIETLTAKLQLIEKFTERQALAQEVAAGATAEQLAAVTRLLGHDAETVRLGAIEILAAARFRPALEHLAAVTLQRAGEERVFAARTLTLLAEPGDRKLLEPLARSWQRSDDRFLPDHAAEILAIVGAPAEPKPEPAARPGPGPAPAVAGFGITAPDRATRGEAIAATLAAGAADAERILVDALRETQPPGIRLDLVTALEKLGPDRFAGVATDFLSRRPLDAEVVTLMARALTRHISELSDARVAEVQAALDHAHRNLSGHALARAAIDEALRVKPVRPSR